MAINLATGYGKSIAAAFSSASFVKDKTGTGFDFSGVKGLMVYTPRTVEMVDYQRSGANRYGEPTEMEDTVQEMMMERDRSFSLTIDKGNNTEQMMTKNAGAMLQLQLQERVAPEVDTYALYRFAHQAGTVASTASALTKTTVIDAIADGIEALDNACVPQDNRYIYLSASVYKLLKTSTEFLGIDSLGEKALAKGIVGEVSGAKVVKVPAKLMPKDCYFIIAHRDAVLVPYKIEDAKIHMDPPGINGALLEGRNLFDAFVVGARSGGVYALVAQSAKLGEVSITCATPGTSPVTLECDGAETIKYTLDGTDPRYSTSAKVYSAGIPTTSLTGTVMVKAFASAEDKYPSDVAESELTIA